MNCSIIGVAVLSLVGSILMATRGTAGLNLPKFCRRFQR
jgi:hypothetical protein